MQASQIARNLLETVFWKTFCRHLNDEIGHLNFLVAVALVLFMKTLIMTLVIFFLDSQHKLMLQPVWQP
jgi:hypothetical protein